MEESELSDYPGEEDMGEQMEDGEMQDDVDGDFGETG